MNQLPFFEEDAQDIPTGYGIEQSHDGGFYPYRIDTENTAQIAHLKDEQGLDLRYASRNEALNVIYLIRCIKSKVKPCVIYAVGNR